MATSNTDQYKFLSKPDEGLKCVICQKVTEEPWQHSICGRLFCEGCLDKRGRDKPCPNCKMEQPQYFPDSKSKRDIKSLRVKCHNVERSCPWEGIVGTVEEHVTTCQFTLLPCPNQCTDHSNKTKHFMRKNLEHHLKEVCPNREYNCPHCGKEGTYGTITLLHDETCQEKNIPCINARAGCPETMQRQHIIKHVKSECEYTMIACKYKSIGCETELKRKDMPAHELDDTLHLHMAIDTITMKERGDIVVKEGDSINFKLIDYNEKKESTIQFTSPPFYTSKGYHMALTVDANGNGIGEGTHVSVYAPIVNGKYDSHLHWPLVGSVTVTLLNQLEDKNHYSMVITLNTSRNVRVGSSWGIPQFIPHSELGHDPIKNTQYLKDDTLYFRVVVEEQDDKYWLKCTNII